MARPRVGDKNKAESKAVAENFSGSSACSVLPTNMNPANGSDEEKHLGADGTGLP